MSQGRQEHGSPASVQRGPGQSPAASTPGLTPELRQLINADVDVRRAASLDNGADSSDMDSGDMDRFQVSSKLSVSLFFQRASISCHANQVHIMQIQIRQGNQPAGASVHP